MKFSFSENGENCNYQRVLCHQWIVANAFFKIFNEDLMMQFPAKKMVLFRSLNWNLYIQDIL